MNVAFSSWLVIILALLGANLPFLNDKVLALIPWRSGRKLLVVRLLEMLFWYCMVGLLAFALEAQIGNAFPQTWEFYATTGCLFLVFAFPGFVLRYLRKRH